ncbi:MAG: HK97 family phage prohead protease [Pseudomonadota bacterium]
MSAAQDLRFAGYAAVFDTPDADRDTIRAGAFAETLANRREPVPLLWQHRPDSVIGAVEFAAEDEHGLRIIARITRPNSRAAAMLRDGAVSGLSFGYRARKARRTDKGRELIGIDLFEVSLVTQPLQHTARVHFVG